MKKLTIIMMALILLVSSVSAASFPKGVDGYVFAQDGITPVPETVEMRITNIGTGEFIEFNPGRGNPGRYSVSVPWPKGTEINITASNPVYTTWRNITIVGISHHVNLYLNMSLPGLPPSFVSLPPESVKQDELFLYVPFVYDWNNDPLSFSLIQGPEGMEINHTNGALTWVPDALDIGLHTIVIEVTDGNFSTEQIIPLYVENVNDPPGINDITHFVDVSLPLFVTQLDAFDLDNDELIFTVVNDTDEIDISSTGLVSFNTENMPEQISFRVKVTDGDLFDEAILTLVRFETTNEQPTPPPPIGGGRAGGGVIPLPDNIPEKIQKKLEEIQRKTGRFVGAPAGVTPTDVLTFRYYEVREGEEFEFSIPQSWFDQNGVLPGDVFLLRYEGEYIRESLSSPEQQGQRWLYFESVEPGIYAIVVDLPVTPPTIETVEAPDETIIVGLVYEGDLPVLSRTPIVIRNTETGDEYLVRTGNNQGQHVFEITLEGVEGDRFDVYPESGYYSGKASFVAESTNRVILLVDRNVGVFSLTGRAISDFAGYHVDLKDVLYLNILLVIIVALIVLVWRIRKEVPE